MSGLVNPATRDLARMGDEKAMVNPALMIPAECRVAVGKLHLCNQHLFGSSALALCATVRVYLDEQPITIEDINRICGRLLQPDIRARCRGSWDVIAELSRLVDEAAKRNRAADATEARRKDAADYRCRVDLGTIGMPVDSD